VQVLRLRLVVLLANRLVWALGLRLAVLVLVLGLRLLLARQAFLWSCCGWSCAWQCGST
jgi:hypothetical protein